MTDVDMAEGKPVENLEDDYPMVEPNTTDIKTQFAGFKHQLSQPDSKGYDLLRKLKSISIQDETIDGGSTDQQVCSTEDKRLKSINKQNKTIVVELKDQHFTSMENKLKNDLQKSIVEITGSEENLKLKIAELYEKNEKSALLLKEKVLLFKQYLVCWTYEMDTKEFDKIILFLFEKDLGDNLLDMLQDVDKMRLFHFEPLVRALALISIDGNNDLKRKAYDLVGKFCYNIPRLFYFVECGREKCRQKEEATLAEKDKGRKLGWNCMRRKAIAQFYTDPSKSPQQLLLQCVKYNRRYNWTHRQILGRCHPKSHGVRHEARSLVLCYLSRNFDRVKVKYDKMMSSSDKPVEEETKNIYEVIRLLHTMKKMKTANKFEELVNCIKNGIHVGENVKITFFLSREHLNTEVLCKKETWQELLKHMKPFAMIRNLGLMTSKRMFCKENSEETNLVVNTLKDKTKLKDVPPIKLLTAIKYYELGHGALTEKRTQQSENENRNKEILRWTPNKAIQKALFVAFHITFQQCKNTNILNQKLMIVVDRRDNMFAESKESLLQPIDFASAMAYFLWGITTKSEVFCFPEPGYSMEKIDLRKDMQFKTVVKKFKQKPHEFVLEDAVEYSIQNNLIYDDFVFITENAESKISTNVKNKLDYYNVRFPFAHNTERKFIVCGVMDGGINEIVANRVGDSHKVAGFGTQMLKEVLEITATLI